MNKFILVLFMLFSANLYSMNIEECEKVENILTDAFTGTLETMINDVINNEIEWSEEDLQEHLNTSLKNGFNNEGLSNYYGSLNNSRLLVSEVLTYPVVASYSKAICLDPSLKDVDDYEKKLAYCNSAASRSKSEVEAVQREATYSCIIESLK